MARRQTRRSVSMSGERYAQAQAQAERLGKPVARFVDECVEGNLDPDIAAAGSQLAVAGEPIEPGEIVTVGPDGRAWRSG